MSSPTPAAATTRRWPFWLAIAGWSILAVGGTALVVFLATVTFGAVHGTEFCPQTFERRTYAYYEVPIVGIQVTGEKHEDKTGGTEMSLTANKLITPPAGGNQDWHVLIGSRGTRLRRPGDAHILIEYLDAKESDDYHRWARWSESHAALAKAFWPGVQRLAIGEAYVYMPDLFDLAKSIDDPVKLQQEVDRLVAEKAPTQKAEDDHSDKAADQASEPSAK
jgi:hypothetical protein